MPGYEYRGTGASLTDSQAAARLQRNGVQPAAPAPSIRGAERVRAFPVRSLYPWAQIAADGGIWRLSPAEFKSPRGQPRPATMRLSAQNFAKNEGLQVKVMVDNDEVYVQFSRRGA